MTTVEAPRSGRVSWHILTGEYPPRPGGVADYTSQVAAGLAEAGDEVHVWTTGAVGPTPEVPGVAVRRWEGGWPGPTCGASARPSTATRRRGGCWSSTPLWPGAARA